jgi:6-pyruvoyltetrahydropterin/6-carboxytetrahydropterin synthase
MDLAILRHHINAVRDELDHNFLDEIKELGPATLENLCDFILERLKNKIGGLTYVKIWRRASGDCCLIIVAKEVQQ